jgi:serine/threonine protein kinase
MARLIPTPSSGGPMGPFEPLVLKTLLAKLPATYAVAPNFQIKPRNGPACEYDFIVLTPHAVYVVEAKEWYGRISGDDSEWLLNQTPKKCPLWLTDHKSKVLKSELGALGNHVYLAPALVVPDGTQLHLGGNWASHTHPLSGLVAYLQDPARVTRASNIAGYLPDIQKILQGRWGARKRAVRQRIGSYQVIETVSQDARSGEYIARHALLEDDTTRYRIRTFRLDPSLSEAAQKEQRAVLCRPAEAITKIGPHPNLLRVLQFDFLDEDHEFFEVTEWYELGTLHGYLSNPDRERLTLRQRLEVAEGVAAALEAVHAHDVVHRNVCPETIVLGFGRVPKLTDFDRAFVEGKQTVFAVTDDRKKNLAYVPPELGNVTDYDFDAASDMYSFGVLLYQLLTDAVPFQNPTEAKAKDGTPEKLPSSLREGIDPSLDQLVLKLLRTDDFHARPTATAARAVLRSALGSTTGASDSPPGPPSTPPPAESFEVGSLLRGVMRVDARLGSGGFGNVLKVFHLDHQRSYALKVLHKVEDAELMLREFNEVRRFLPDHPNIAKIEWMDRLDPPERLPCLLMELVEGEPLTPYCDGRKKLSWTDIRRIGVELLDALAAIHPDGEEYERRLAEARVKELDEAEYEAFRRAQEKASRGLAHRDIKPDNILLEMPSHRVKIIDFNIAEVVGLPVVKARTPPYAPADWESASLMICSRAGWCSTSWSPRHILTRTGSRATGTRTIRGR